VSICSSLFLFTIRCDSHCRLSSSCRFCCASFSFFSDRILAALCLLTSDIIVHHSPLQLVLMLVTCLLTPDFVMLNFSHDYFRQFCHVIDLVVRVYLSSCIILGDVPDTKKLLFQIFPSNHFCFNYVVTEFVTTTNRRFCCT